MGRKQQGEEGFNAEGAEEERRGRREEWRGRMKIRPFIFAVGQTAPVSEGGRYKGNGGIRLVLVIG
jgi:hypothetical protein